MYSEAGQLGVQQQAESVGARPSHGLQTAVLAREEERGRAGSREEGEGGGVGSREEGRERVGGGGGKIGGRFGARDGGKGWGDGGCERGFGERRGRGGGQG